MKKKLLFASCFFALALSHAQESLPIKPFSSVANINDYETTLATGYVGIPDLTNIAADDIRRDNQGKFYRTGIIMPTDFTLANSGTWSLLANGDKVWRIQITAPDAKGTSLYFNKFYLPVGSRMHVYSPDREQMIGAFTSYNNHSSMLFTTVALRGESCIVEYYEPADVAGQGIISINEVAYIYRGADMIEDEQMGNMRSSDPCEVDVKCPEGDAWTDMIRGVCRVDVKEGTSYGYCSGSAINNTNQDCTPYILTAQHCGQDASAADFLQWKFRFNYQKGTCGGTGAAGQSMTGCVEIANSNDAGGSDNLNQGDFILCKLNSNILATCNAYFNGWDHSGTVSPSGVGIHHPAGDYKKISTYSTNTVITSWSGTTPNTHWRVTWAATVTNHGVTEGGSSGSPLFNNNHLIIGQLSGGSSYCTSPTAPDLYGRTAYDWQSSGTTTNRQLKPWLDPTNSGVNTLVGKNNTCTTGEKEFEIEDLFSIYPNPATDLLTIESTGFNETVHKITIYDQTGKLVTSFDVMPGSIKKSISLQGFEKGVYNVRITNGERTTTRKFVKM
jgi:V8-like Glu-specific endopeptidase